MTRHLTTLSLLAALLTQTGCTVVSANRAFPKLDWYWSKDAQQQRQEIKQEKLLTPQPVAISAARVQLSAVVVTQPKTKTWQWECWAVTNNSFGYMQTGLDYKDNLLDPNWTPLVRFPLTTVSNSYTVNLDKPQCFYRAVIY